MRVARGSRSRIFALTCSGVLAASFAPAASAQVITPDGSIALPGIVVVGEKFSRSLQDTTSSVTVITGAEIKDQRKVLPYSNVTLKADAIGFAPLAFAILMVLFLRFGVPPLRGAVIAALTVLFIHLTFVTLLRVPLPGGLIDRLLW